MPFSRYALTLSTALALVAGLSVASQSAFAQKAKDTVRIAVEQPIQGLDPIYDPQPQATLMNSAVFDSLMWYDDAKREFGGLLAQSWKRVDDRTIEFTLKQGVKFHDGSEFDADDAVYTIAHVIDPKTNFRFKENRFGWIESAEKLGKYQMRVRSKEIYAPFLQSVAVSLPIYPSDLHEKLESKPAFGKNAIGSGPYRVVSVSDNAGVQLEQSVGFTQGKYADGTELKLAGGIKTLQFLPIPDKQTQVAQMLVGNLEIMYEVNPDQAENLRSNPNLKILAYPSVQFSYIAPDVANRSGIGVFKDPRVREAIFRAVDREAMKKAFVPKEMWDTEPLPGGMCHKWHVACDYTVPLVGYDPEKSKALLKEAGYENGFDLVLGNWGATTPQSQAVAGYLRAVGIRASVNSMPFNVYNKVRDDGQIQTFVGFWDNGGGQPDVNGTARFFFDPSPRNYTHDAKLAELAEAGYRELDIEKRKVIYRELFNRVTEQLYFFPLMPMPALVVHHKDVVLRGGHMGPKGFQPNYLSWAK
jgi:peptide/nickel transport system substrate-binding protein